MRSRRWRLTLLPAALALCGAAPPLAVTYALSPVFTDGALQAVAVEMHLTGGADGTTTLDLPGDFGGVKDHWRYVRDLTVDGATVDGDGAARILHHASGAPLTVRYRVVSAYPADPTGDDGNPYAGAVVRPAWFAALGNFLFATPHGGDKALASFAWTGWPAGWTHASDADHGALGRTMTVDDVVESTLLAGPDVTLETRPITGGTLRLATRGEWTWSTTEYADTMARILSAERGFWSDVGGPFTVTLFQLVPGKSHTSSGGTGRGDGFAQYSSPDVPESVLIDNIAHEHTHTWIPRRIGEMPDGEAEAALYWFSEGFTDFYTLRTLLRAGVWTPEQFVAGVNGRLAEYASSPARTYPNARIAKDFWTDPAVEQLPYRRGELFAHRLDRRLRQAGRADGLDGVLFAMRDRWVAAPVDAKPPLLADFMAVMAGTGVDVRDDLARYIDAGEPLELAADQFGDCATVATITIPAFDIGFDRGASAKAGVFAGVDPNGPAYAAGLRDGMKRIARVEGGREGDSRVAVGYRVAQDGRERTIGWKPEGRGRLTLQDATLTPELSDAARAACARQLAGG